MLQSIDWLEITKIITTIWVATVGTLALSTWKRQLKANKKIEYLDHLTEAIDEFISHISNLLSSIKWTKEQIKYYAEANARNSTIEDGAIEYIRKYGNETSKNLLTQLEKCRQIQQKLNLLNVKGQMFDFNNSMDLHHSYNYIEQEYNRLHAFAYFIGQETLNWDNDEVSKTLKKMVALDIPEIEKGINSAASTIIEFVKINYKKV